MARKPQDKCKRDHKLKEPNLIFRMRDGKKIRECKTCAADARKARREARKRNAALMNGDAQ